MDTESHASAQRAERLIHLAETQIWTPTLATMFRQELRGRGAAVSPYANVGEMAETLELLGEKGR